MSRLGALLSFVVLFHLWSFVVLCQPQEAAVISSEAGCEHLLAVLRDRFEEIRRRELLRRQVKENLFQNNSHFVEPMPESELAQMEYHFSVGGGTWDRSYENVMHVWGALGLRPKDFRGDLAVDIGAGLSNFADELFERDGVNGFGVDIIFDQHYGYSKVPELDTFDEIQASALAAGLDMGRRIGASATRLPFQDNSVAFTTAFMSTMYLPSFSEIVALYETLRVLKPGHSGYFVHDDDPGPYLNIHGQMLAKQLRRLRVPYVSSAGGAIMKITKPMGFRFQKLSRTDVIDSSLK